jgi:cyanophycinase
MKSKRKAKEETAVQDKKQNHCPVPKGILVVIGGKENKGAEAPENKEKPSDFIRLQVLQAFRDLIPRREPVVEVVTTSSSEGPDTFREYVSAFEKVGIQQPGHIHHNSRREVLADPMIERLKNADAIFFSGGDQLKLTSIYGGTDFLTQLKQQYIEDPLVVGGTSAGAMALSTPMIYAGNNEVQELGSAIKVTTGLEFMKDVCIDTHFVRRGRFVRMAQVIFTNPTCIGMGIEEDTCIIVRNGIEVEVAGTGLVIVVDGFAITEARIEDFTKDKPVSIRDLKVHLLSEGDRYLVPQINPAHK